MNIYSYTFIRILCFKKRYKRYSIYNIVKNTNKKTPEEIRDNARIRKQQQRERLKEKYGDDEYKKKHAQEISDYRKSKKEPNN